MVHLDVLIPAINAVCIIYDYKTELTADMTVGQGIAMYVELLS